LISERVSYYCFQLYHGENKSHFNEMMITSSLYLARQSRRSGGRGVLSFRSGPNSKDKFWEMTKNCGGRFQTVKKKEDLFN
jgi:hypothetical protein